MCANKGRELTNDSYHTLVLSASTNFDSHFTSMTCETSRRVRNTKIGDKNFHQDSPSEVTEEFDCNMCASATTVLDNITNYDSDTYLPS